MEGTGSAAAARPVGATPLEEVISPSQNLVVLDHTDSIRDALHVPVPFSHCYLFVYILYYLFIYYLFICECRGWRSSASSQHRSTTASPTNFSAPYHCLYFCFVLKLFLSSNKNENKKVDVMDMVAFVVGASSQSSGEGDFTEAMERQFSRPVFDIMSTCVNPSRSSFIIIIPLSILLL